MKNYLTIIEFTGKNYCAYSPDVLGCVSAGDTLDETLQNMKEALEFHLEDEAKLPVAHTLQWHLKNGLQFEKGSIFCSSRNRSTRHGLRFFGSTQVVLTSPPREVD